MDAFLEMPLEARRRLCDEAQARLQLRAASIEKDFWICWTLRELFALDEIGRHLTFKGGTSLAKSWKLIERFSEDLDVTISRAFLGFGGASDPAAASTTSQRSRRVSELREHCAAWVAGALAPALRERFEARLPRAEDWRLSIDADDESGLTLLFDYPTSYAEADPAQSYVRPVARIELGALADTEPHGDPTITPYLADEFPALLPASAFSIRTLSPERTFWEKVMLLHEEGYRAAETPPRPRMARHYYDLWCLVRKGVADGACADPELFARVAAHRAVFFRRSQAARESLRPGTLRVRPREHHLETWKRDYRAMQRSMIFGERPSFDEILSEVGRFEDRFNEGTL